MGPESSWVKVKDLAQEGLILMTIFEAELSAITFHCAPEQPIPSRPETCPGRRLVARALGYGIRFIGLRRCLPSRHRSAPGPRKTRAIGHGGLDALRHPVGRGVSSSGQIPRSSAAPSHQVAAGRRVEQQRRARRNSLDPECQLDLARQRQRRRNCCTMNPLIGSARSIG